jgi:hypothetical protein
MVLLDMVVAEILEQQEAPVQEELQELQDQLADQHFMLIQIQARICM